MSVYVHIRFLFRAGQFSTCVGPPKNVAAGAGGVRDGVRKERLSPNGNRFMNPAAGPVVPEQPVVPDLPAMPTAPAAPVAVVTASPGVPAETAATDVANSSSISDEHVHLANGVFLHKATNEQLMGVQKDSHFNKIAAFANWSLEFLVKRSFTGTITKWFDGQKAPLLTN
ncbi:hypothetical protein HPB51_029204 [Rhipicephalus microplus]|uniref:Uncharacterized protein n=1 Tax=Rhipicephalus microplus TaxID=6941 RepID=A0A9J6CVI8_RHIMP|nr:hypothetical protein HPB51_029204 [Rhipicephalus microplus]